MWADIFENSEKDRGRAVSVAMSNLSVDALIALVTFPVVAVEVAIGKLEKLADAGKLTNEELDKWIELASNLYVNEAVASCDSLFNLASSKKCCNLTLSQLQKLLKVYATHGTGWLGSGEKAFKAYKRHPDYTEKSLLELAEMIPKMRNFILGKEGG